MIIPGRVVSIIVATGLLGVTAVSVIVAIFVHFGNFCVDVSAPTNVEIKSVGEYTKILWKPPLDAGNCSIHYSLRYKIDDEDYKQVKTQDLFYAIPRLLPCTYIRVSIWSVSDSSGEKSEHFAVGRYAEDPKAIVAPKLNGDPLEDGKGFQITWRKPKHLHKCRLEYKLEIRTDFRKRRYTYIMSSTSFLVVNRFYCFIINTKIAARYNGKQGRFRFRRFVHNHNITGFKILPRMSKMTITWTRHPKEILCSLVYDIVYNIKGHPPQMKTANSPEAEFDVVFCVPGTVKVTVAYRNIRNLGKKPVLIYPKPMWTVPDLKITSRNDQQVATWGLPPAYKWCRPKYHVRVESDIYDYIITTTQREHVVGNEKYCFYLNVHVQAVLLSILGNYAKSGPTEFVVSPPRDLKLNSSLSDNSVTATWKDVNPKKCAVTFKVKNSATKLDHMLSETQLTFGISYCITATIAVISVGMRRQESEPVKGDVKAGDPSFVLGVKNVTTKEHLKYLHVYWEKPDFVEHCATLMFHVTATSNNQTSTCFGATTCYLMLVTYCPVTTLELKPSMPGEVVYAKHVCPSYKSNSIRLRFYFHKLLFLLHICINILFFKRYLL